MKATKQELAECMARAVKRLMKEDRSYVLMGCGKKKPEDKG